MEPKLPLLSRYITHMLKLQHSAQALANFLASGVFNLREKLGPSHGRSHWAVSVSIAQHCVANCCRDSMRLKWLRLTEPGRNRLVTVRLQARPPRFELWGAGRMDVFLTTCYLNFLKRSLPCQFSPGSSWG